MLVVTNEFGVRMELARLFLPLVALACTTPLNLVRLQHETACTRGLSNCRKDSFFSPTVR